MKQVNEVSCCNEMDAMLPVQERVRALSEEEAFNLGSVDIA